MPALADLAARIDTLTDEEVAELHARYIQPPADLLNFADLRIWTREDPPRFIDFTLNTIQRALLDTLQSQQGVSHPWELKGLRSNCLKSRQQGMSTFWLSLWYLMFYNCDYSQTVVITHRAESTARLWQTVQTWEQDVRRRKTLPKLSISNRRELVRSDTGSSILIATAGMSDVATSGVITNVHRSESALWPAGSDSQIVGILGAVPAWGNIIEESTARGYGPHKDRWDRQEDTAQAFFFPYTDTAEYAIEPPPGFVREEAEEGLTATRILAGRRESVLVTDAAVLWRRRKHRAYTDEGKPEATAQEFPLSPSEAFAASADASYYPGEYLRALLDEFRDVEPIRVIRPGEDGFGGTIRVWEEPEEGEEYVIGADEAEGFTNEAEHDDSAAVGLNVRTRRLTFAYIGRPDGVHFAHDLDGLSGYYNTAMVVPERVPMGGTLTNVLIDLGVNLYRHNTGKEDAPERTKYGFPAHAKLLRDGVLKALLCRAAAVWEKCRDLRPSEAAEEAGCPVLCDWQVLRQLMHYSNLKGGKRGGVGERDDFNTAVTLAAWWVETWGYEAFEIRGPVGVESGLMRARRV